MDKKSCLVKVAIVFSLCVPFFGCDSSHTPRSGSTDLSSVYVAGNDENGSIDLVVDSTTMQVGNTGGFLVTVVGRNNEPISDMRVACDSEKGIAIVEPATGYEMTNASGRVSGVIGCEYAGSFRFGCRLPVGVNKRKFVSIRCEGLGSASWPNAAGGGLGGGSQGTDVDGDLRVSGVKFYDGGHENPTSIDLVGEQCGDIVCDDDECVCKDEEDSNCTTEVFTPAQVKFRLVNESSLGVNLTSMSYVFGGVSSSNISINFRIGGNTTYESDWVPFLESLGGQKRIYGQSDPLEVDEWAGMHNVSFTLVGIDSAGEQVEIQVSSVVNLSHVLNCK